MPSNPMQYGMVSAAEGEGGISGGAEQPMVTFYVQVPDLTAALDRATSLGGKVIMPPMEVSGGPTIAQFADPEGNVIGLLKG